jgi:hypothetical protein
LPQTKTPGPPVCLHPPSINAPAPYPQGREAGRECVVARTG